MDITHLIFALFFIISYRSAINADECENRKEIVCYFGSWAVYREGNGQFTTQDIDPNLCTTIIYSFIGLDINYQIASLDSNADIGLGGFSNTTNLKNANPCLKVVLAIGGWNEGSLKYSVVSSTEEGRKEFADKALKFIAYYGFDGLDIDWEYPTSRGGLQADKENFGLLLAAVKARFQPYGLRLSIAVSMEQDLLEKAYDVKAISDNVDFVHLMGYDYTSGSSNVTGLLAPLTPIKGSVSFWLENGLPSEKLILGVPTYARYFILEDLNNHGIGAPLSVDQEMGPYTNEVGFLAYYEWKLFLTSNNCIVQTEVVDSTKYSYCVDEWYSYDDEETLKIKAQYILETDLGGAMIWSLDTDDFRGTYGQKYPLLTTLYDAFNENN